MPGTSELLGGDVQFNGDPNAGEFDATAPEAQGVLGATAQPGAAPVSPMLAARPAPPEIPEAALAPETSGADGGVPASRAWVESRLGDWDGEVREPEQEISSTERFDARRSMRGISPRSPNYQTARQFLRTDGSAPRSARDTIGTQGDQLRPAPVDFAGTSLGGKRAAGFKATPQDTAAKVKEDFAYAGLRTRYQFPRANPDEGGSMPRAF